MSLGERVIELAHKIDRKVSWHRLPLPLSLPLLALMRDRLREQNLYDTGQPPGLEPPETNGSSEPAYLTSRTWDGTYNDLEDPLMGSTGSRFGRNVPLEHTFPEQEPRLSTPSVRKVSRELMTRDEFIPATTLNVLAAAWIQFEVHDWFSHGPNDLKEPYEIAPRRRRRLAREPDDHPAHAARRDLRSERAPDLDHGRHALVGQLADLRAQRGFADRARTGEGGRLRIEADGTLPVALEEERVITSPQS